MSTEMVVNVSPRETRAALLENGVLQELFVERASKLGLTGNLYKGRVSRVLPGMQAAFVEIGLARTAFLHVADILGPPPDPVNDAQEPREPAHLADIRALVHEGDELLVQVVKDPIGTKGARLSTHVSLPSRYLVFMPRGSRVGWGQGWLHRTHGSAGRATGSAACRHDVSAASVGACARTRPQ